MTLLVVLVVLIVVAALAAAAGVFDGPRGVRRRRVVVEERPVREVVREVAVERDPVVTERRVVRDDPRW